MEDKTQEGAVVLKRLLAELLGEQKPQLRSGEDEARADRILVEDQGPRVTFTNAWGCRVEVQRPGRLASCYTATAEISLQRAVDPRQGRMEQSEAWDDWSRTPQAHEQSAFEQLMEHEQALAGALRSAGFRPLGDPSGGARVYRCADPERPPTVRESRVEVEAAWILETSDPERMAVALSLLMRVQHATCLDSKDEQTK